jgi:hypothetical protein
MEYPGGRNGDTYSGGMTFVMGETDVTLYAKWAVREAPGTLDTTFDPGTGANRPFTQLRSSTSPTVAGPRSVYLLEELLPTTKIATG